MSGPPHRLERQTEGLAPHEGAGPSRFGHLLIVGASVRAAAASVARAGWSPWGIDLFDDVDLAALGPSRRVDRAGFPEALVAEASAAPRSPWFYTGPLENHPEVVDRIGRSRPLWGIGGDSLRAVRDPLRVSEVVRRAGLPCPDVRLDPTGLPHDGTWLVKPLRSAGGIGIREYRGQDAAGVGEPAVFQRRVVGRSMAALYRAGTRRCRFLGAMEQWIGREGEPFAYAGSLGPLELSSPIRSTLRRLGEALRAEFALRGLFGVDLILASGQPWLIEVNPRYTASMEVLEWATGRNLIAEHAAVFDAALARPGFRPAGRVAGKAVVYAEEVGSIDAVPKQGGLFRWSEVADWPRPGERFAAGDPVLTVLARGATLSDCRASLVQAREHWRRKLRPT